MFEQEGMNSQPWLLSIGVGVLCGILFTDIISGVIFSVLTFIILSIVKELKRNNETLSREFIAPISNEDKNKIVELEKQLKDVQQTLSKNSLLSDTLELLAREQQIFHKEITENVTYNLKVLEDGHKENIKNIFNAFNQLEQEISYCKLQIAELSKNKNNNSIDVSKPRELITVQDEVFKVKSLKKREVDHLPISFSLYDTICKTEESISNSQVLISSAKSDRNRFSQELIQMENSVFQEETEYQNNTNDNNENNGNIIQINENNQNSEQRDIESKTTQEPGSKSPLISVHSPLSYSDPKESMIFEKENRSSKILVRTSTDFLPKQIPENRKRWLTRNSPLVELSSSIIKRETVKNSHFLQAAHRSVRTNSQEIQLDFETLDKIESSQEFEESDLKEEEQFSMGSIGRKVRNSNAVLLLKGFL